MEGLSESFNSSGGNISNLFDDISNNSSQQSRYADQLVDTLQNADGSLLSYEQQKEARLRNQQLLALESIDIRQRAEKNKAIQKQIEIENELRDKLAKAQIEESEARTEALKAETLRAASGAPTISVEIEESEYAPEFKLIMTKMMKAFAIQASLESPQFPLDLIPTE